jgi:hypothetical protein
MVDPNDPNASTVIDLYAAGYAVVVFNPTELASASPDKVMDALIEHGWQVIEQLKSD